MPFTANRRRPIQVKFFVDEHELAVIKQRMGEFGTNNLSTYLRTMAMEGIFPAAEGEESTKQERCEKA